MEIPLYECFDFSAIRVNKGVEVNFACVMRSREFFLSLFESR